MISFVVDESINKQVNEYEEVFEHISLILIFADKIF